MNDAREISMAAAIAAILPAVEGVHVERIIGNITASSSQFSNFLIVPMGSDVVKVQRACAGHSLRSNYMGDWSS